ncbi:hypothetical protein WICPIJ_007425 [Wickerhamomyces pijperi]|uniref:Uncharacterized protein n=1 Tax=Wickerhamomyces pijperi TaxID=599730 RepID=A0A9P8Q2F9_WICPI|nr:hypothetical protein WICPIJ_007425 [Wickerhamomyces pijperi]
MVNTYLRLSTQDSNSLDTTVWNDSQSDVSVGGIIVQKVLEDVFLVSVGFFFAQETHPFVSVIGRFQLVCVNGLQTDSVWEVPSEVSSVHNYFFNVHRGTQLDDDPVDMASSSGSLCFPTVTHVMASAW